MGVSGGAVVVVDVSHGFIGQLPRSEYSTGIFPTTAVDLSAVKAAQNPTHFHGVIRSLNV